MEKESDCIPEEDLKSSSTSFSEIDEAYQAQQDVLEKIELFFCSADYTSAIGDFMSEHVGTFTAFDLEQEQPLEYYSVFQQYQDLVEAKFEAFVKKEDVSTEVIYAVCRNLHSQDNGASTCIEYLLACTEYEYFLKLMYDFRMMNNPDDGFFSDDFGSCPREQADDRNNNTAPLVAASKK
uniref:Cilia- and flagella-associated protein 36 n=1 Tax=Heterosigma akashiwo TaxID=2829 RepID=A0A6V1NIC6_HETAK|mmetsp:Transcript_45386/g.66268  ORF Transcript_45386/g.66268 Transcript_45386/m.66268 type:complete len:180 (+) Transcript_45386:124-663(+)|eukprot:CAMPEP_0194564184 /NCGR_PEP_ID=MMETSP0292-20121207/3939_1 /TAXON_ID=39354 /ORGANISM="Heterosigma akashiwo, Strain CCMP2393" /LENGTH=179 /DNA_ID=CAMNT_0039413259 /DNA_START=119 /DNA_END=658 /DNA_ORIENTATION=-